MSSTADRFFAFFNGMVAGTNILNGRMVASLCYATFRNHQSQTSNPAKRCKDIQWYC